ncbi:MAG: hypothetical protein B6I38_03100 [Anaerolineaceae bacterium 4572_5.1]|nr:MAG: hypothetical protein B6I38_03100 [Anaerolineaceae bacterium 4572_5.1]
MAEWLPKNEAKTLARDHELKTYIDTLPKDRAGYGLIHQDAHGGNFFIKDGAITLFDFDDCMYGWFIYDIAMVLFYAALGKEDMAAFTKTFMGDFLQGYAQENMLAPPMAAGNPAFPQTT